MNHDMFKEIVQSCHINLLAGSGLSTPFLSTLGNIEKYLSELQVIDCSESTKKIATVSLMKSYFDLSIKKNKDLLGSTSAAVCKDVCDKYSVLLKSINGMVLHRRTSLLNKQVNLFTTNMDIFLERCLEDAGIEFNDGYSGSLNRKFSLSNFKKSIIKTSSHYGNTSELPLINIFKIHGSVTWTVKQEGVIGLDCNLDNITAISNVELADAMIVPIFKEIPSSSGDTVRALKTTQEITDEAKSIKLTKKHIQFIEEYEKLVIVNPTKEKFKFTTLNYVYYELLRMFSNELERENSVLFVMGFSFADEHIREIVLRALNSNPTLVVCVFAYDDTSEGVIKDNLNVANQPSKYNNLKFMPRPIAIGDDTNVERPFDLKVINEVYFERLAEELAEAFGRRSI